MAIDRRRFLVTASALAAASGGFGAIGAALTHFGAMPIAAGLRRFAGLGLTTAAGALCGALYCLEEMHLIPARTLYVVWQPAVAWCIGLAISSSSTAFAPSTPTS